MRVFKPLQPSLQYKNFSWQNKNQFAVTLLLGFPFDNEREVLLEQELWQFLGDQLGKNAMLDMGMPKLKGEVLVYGSYYAPDGLAVSADQVQVEIGAVGKSLAVIGNRYWRSLLGPTEPEHFRELPISYEFAFGGKDYKANPTGKGMDDVDYFGETRLPMPNIEDPDNLVTSANQRPEPAGLGPLDMMWEQRAAKTGTYDETWQRDHFPGYPPDLDWTHFNTAAPDQWIHGYWQGDESFSIKNMHPQKPQLKGRLPAFRARCFIERLLDEETLFTEVEMQAETVCLFPSVETGVMIYRGLIEVIEDDGADVKHLLVGYEDMTQSPRTREYYEEALRNRLNEDKAIKYMMYTKDIIPDSERCGFARMMDGVDQGGESELAKNMEAKAEAEKQKALAILEEQKNHLKRKLEASGVDPSPYLEKFEIHDEPPDDPHVKGIIDTMEKILPGSTMGDGKHIKVDEIDIGKIDEIAEKMDAMAEAKKEEARQQLKDVVRQVEGTEIEAQVRVKVETAIKRMDEPPDLPRPKADEMLEGLKQQLQKIEEVKTQMVLMGVPKDQLPKVDISIVEIEQKLQESFVAMKDMYRGGAHYIEGKPPHKVPMDIIQYRLKKALDKGDSLAGRDLAGVDLSGLDLSGMDFSECYLEYTNLSNVNLSGANLDRAIVTHANLSHANLTGASLVQANLGNSKLSGADLTDAVTAESEFSKADLEGARIVNCDLSGANFLETRFVGADLSGSDFSNSNFLDLEFQGANFSGSDLSSCNFTKGQMENVDFSKARLEGANFIECRLDHSRFVEADMRNVRFLAGCSLSDCNFDKAVLDKANLRDTEAQNCRFEESSFNQADFGGANLQDARFYGGVGKRASFMKSDLAGADFSSVNLMEGSLMKARLTNANLSHSNFYAVEFMNATIGDTDFTGANLDLTKLEDWGPGQ